MKDPMLYSRDEQLRDTSAQRPHLVILGAGASKAACPNGDKNGLKLPIMLDLVETLDLADDLDRAGINHKGQNFEVIYEDISSNSKLSHLRQLIEIRIADYFAGLVLPDQPTIYDYLVLSLRPKDAIATFNWDPFLWKAHERNHRRAPLPKIFFLHGCSIVGWCETDKIQGLIGRPCRKCRTAYAPTRLLFPVRNKNYISDPYISSQWRPFQVSLDGAFLLTIFGYGAPKSDAAAIDLMSQAWGTPFERVMEEVEMIDIKPENLLEETWNRFIHSHHYSVRDDYFDSILAKYPRRSVEAYWQSIVEVRSREENPVSKTESLDELWEWFNPLFEQERSLGG